MTAEERERMSTLCSQIAAEKEHAEFLSLVKELNDLLERTDHQLQEKSETN